MYNASVPFAQDMQCATPFFFENLLSNSFTSGPRINADFLITEDIASSNSLLMDRYCECKSTNGISNLCLSYFSNWIFCINPLFFEMFLVTSDSVPIFASSHMKVCDWIL